MASSNALDELPNNWSKCFSKTRKLEYFYNTITCQSVWTIEEVFEIEKNSQVKKSYDADKTVTEPKEPSYSSRRCDEKLRRSLIISDTAKLTPNQLRDSLKKKVLDRNLSKITKNSKSAKESINKQAKVVENIKSTGIEKVKTDDSRKTTRASQKDTKVSKKTETQPLKTPIDKAHNSQKTQSKSFTIPRIQNNEAAKMDIVEITSDESNQDTNDEAMEVEIIENINEIRRKELINDNTNSLSSFFTPTQKLDQNRKFNSYCKLIVVLDTNILITNLNKIKELLDNNLTQTNNLIFFIIPWIVIKELDILKVFKPNEAVQSQSTSVAPRARQANKFLLDKAKDNCEFVIFQTSLENDEKLSEIKCFTNDDYILKCAVKAKYTYSDCRVILLTNDRNLQTKAIITNINSLSNDDLMKEISNGTKSLQGSRQDHTHQQANTSINEQNNNGDQKLNSIFGKMFYFIQNEILNGVVELLSFIYQNEMIKAYDDIWIDLVLIKAPWDLKAINANINKHYNVLFGFTMPMNARQYWQSVSECIKGFCEKSNQPSNKLQDNLNRLKSIVKMMTDLTNFLKLIDQNYFQNQNFLSLANYLHLLSTYSLKVYEIFNFYMETELKNSIQTNSNDAHELTSCFEVFEPIWSRFHELCCKICDSNQYVDRNLYFMSTFYLTILKDLKRNYENCLNFSSSDNLQSLGRVMFLLYYLFDLKSINFNDNNATNLSSEFILIHNALSKCFLSLRHSEVMQNGLNQLNEFILKYEDKQLIFTNKLLDKSIISNSIYN